MTNTRLDTPHGAWIDRSRPVTFKFEGRSYSGYAGDTITSALWANGVRVLGRSFKYHRPRGVLSLSDWDVNAVVETRDTTNIRADVTPLSEGASFKAVNTHGSVARDRAAIVGRFSRFMPVGFYYKAFHKPRSLFMFFENRIRAMAGLGSVNFNKRFTHTPKDYDFCDVLVVGAGPAGLSAALEAAESGLDVLLVDENPRLGGSLAYRYGQRGGSPEKLAERVATVEAHPGIRVRTSTQAVIHNADGWVGLVDGTRLTKLRAATTVYAVGVTEQLAVFRHNDLPGIMLSTAAMKLVHLYGVKPMEKAAVLTANDDGYEVALDLAAAGTQVIAVIDMRGSGEAASPLAARVEAAGIAIHRGYAVYEGVAADGVLSEVRVRRLLEGGRTDEAQEIIVRCDGLVMSVGWAAADNMPRQAGARMVYDAAIEQYRPAELPAGVFAAGRLNGIFGLEEQLADGRAAGAEAAAHLGKPAASIVRPSISDPAPSHPFPMVEHPEGKEFVELDEDITIKDCKDAIDEGFDLPELLKRYSTVGMGPSQGKLSNLNALKILVQRKGQAMEGRMTTTARPYASPVAMGLLAGRGFSPMRRTPMHERHLARGARMMHAGAWFRPEYYASSATTREAAIQVEARAVRESVGMVDQGTLGKLELCGPDALAFIERYYTNKFTKLAVGRGRYAVAVDESGVVIDDGMVARLGEDRFYVTTTSSASDGAYRNMLRWKLLWGLDVTITNLTSDWSAMNLAGPDSAEVLGKLTELDLSGEAFPYMGVREGLVAGVPARLARVGFVGEWSFEIHVPADGALAVWDAIMEAGKDFGLRPFGIEAQRLLRLEKGHIIIGQDTDAMTTPFEAGLDWIIKDDKPFFVGQRSLRIMQQRPLERIMVGYMLPGGYAGLLPQESNLTLNGSTITGRVTSIVRSVALDRPIGLCTVAPDMAEPGNEIQIKLSNGERVDAIVTAPHFYDPDNTRQLNAKATIGVAAHV